jgi:eukaryotic translation initiation factor 2C
MESMAKDLIINFGNTTGKPPTRIIFYRDGVSEGQFDEVAREEITALKSTFDEALRCSQPADSSPSAGACTSIKATYQPDITFIICGKRHHVKMFPTAPQDGDRNGNVRSGTLVDREIGSPYYSDFVSPTSPASRPD